MSLSMNEMPLSNYFPETQMGTETPTLAPHLSPEAPRQNTIRTVLLCETQPLTVEGIRAVLAASPDLRVIGVCENLAVCRELARKHRPDIILLDKALGMQVLLDWMQNLKLSDLDNLRQSVALGALPADRTTLDQANTAAGETRPSLLPVIWGVSITEAEALRFLQAGAKGILRKSTTPGNMLNCLRTVSEGKNWMEDSVFREQPRDDRYPRSELTPREQQVMELVEHGMKNREIARELGIRPGTVKIHLKHIFEKTGVRGRYGLALTGLRQKGILAVDKKQDALVAR
ncbi:MAG: response regulator transcription factor [Bryobacter sp.]|nr:response regulator transcription factor [Bryobacter sp.]